MGTGETTEATTASETTTANEAKTKTRSDYGSLYEYVHGSVAWKSAMTASDRISELSSLGNTDSNKYFTECLDFIVKYYSASDEKTAEVMVYASYAVIRHYELTDNGDVDNIDEYKIAVDAYDLAKKVYGSFYGNKAKESDIASERADLKEEIKEAGL